MTKFNTSSSFAETQKLQILAQKERKRWGIFLFSLFVGVDCFLCNISTFCGSFVNVYFLLRCVLFPAIFFGTCISFFPGVFFFYSSFPFFIFGRQPVGCTGSGSGPFVSGLCLSRRTFFMSGAFSRCFFFIWESQTASSACSWVKAVASGKWRCTRREMAMGGNEKAARNVSAIVIN